MRSPQHLVAFLAAVSKHKVIDACRHYLGAQKYNVRRETSLAELAAEDNDRRERRLGSRGLEAPDPTPSRIASVRERWNHVVAQSSKRDRNIIALRIEGKTYHAISANLGVSKATVQRVLARLIGEMLE
jgi:RNA polymerase sigma factor (sigma-70 family)